MAERMTAEQLRDAIEDVLQGVAADSYASPRVATDAIMALLPDAPRWIAASEGLPPAPNDPDADAEIVVRLDGSLEIDRGLDIGWWDVDQERWIWPGFVSHWLKDLPSLPAGDKE